MNIGMLFISFVYNNKIFYSFCVGNFMNRDQQY